MTKSFGLMSIKVRAPASSEESVSLLRRVGISLFALPALLLASCATITPTVHVTAGAVTLPSGLTDSLVAPIPVPTAIGPLPDGRIVVTSKDGGVYLIGADGVAQPGAILTFSDICKNSERGVLGVVADPAFATNNYVYIYATRNTAGGCRNMVLRYTMSGNTLPLASEFMVINNIGSPGGNHNGGDIHFGKDGLLYVAVGDGGGGTSSSPDSPAQKTNSMNGKILRVKADGTLPTGNMFPGGVRCGIDGDTTSGQNCGEIFALGLRNPFRIIPDNNATATRFLINDVGLDTQEEIDELAPGANFGWPVREGLCARAGKIPCDTNPGAGVTNPLHAYNHYIAPNGKECGVITGGALPPTGWTGKAGNTYLFADFGCELIFEVSGLGTTNTITTFATGVGSVSDMLMVQEASGWSMYYTTFAGGGEVHRIRSAAVVAQPGPGHLVPITPTRVLDTRENLGASVGKPKAKSVTTFRLPTSVVPANATAIAINLTGVAPAGPGFATAWATGYAQPAVSNLNFASAGETSANAAILPVSPGGNVDIYVDTPAHLIVDVTGYWMPSTSASDGRFTSTDPSRILDTRNGTGVPAAGAVAAGGKIDVQVTGKGGVPTTGVSAVAMVVTSANPAAAGFVTVWPSDKPIPQASALNPMGNDVRANLVIVPVSSTGKVSMFASTRVDLLADVAGWFTDTSASSSGSGLLQTLTPTRVVDTRDTKAPWKAGETRTATIGPVGLVQGNFVYNLTAANTGGWGFLTAFLSGATPPTASNVNFERAGQNRAALAITKGKALEAGGAASMSLYSFSPTDVLIDSQAYFTS
jgi:glucose/arabinose dehydrogenase